MKSDRVGDEERRNNGVNGDKHRVRLVLGGGVEFYFDKTELEKNKRKHW